jgi:hypothetical protein
VEIENKMRTAYKVFVNFKKVYISVRREVLYNILIEFGVHEIRLIKLCLNEIYNTVHIGKYLFNSFRIQISAKH